MCLVSWFPLASIEKKIKKKWVITNSKTRYLHLLKSPHKTEPSLIPSFQNQQEKPNNFFLFFQLEGYHLKQAVLLTKQHHRFSKWKDTPFRDNVPPPNSAQRPGFDRSKTSLEASCFFFFIFPLASLVLHGLEDHLATRGLKKETRSPPSVCNTSADFWRKQRYPCRDGMPPARGVSWCVFLER